jgi:predicted TIM-barrel fold metal-dependent hydrolase
MNSVRGDILNKALKGRKLEDVYIIDAHGHLDLWKSSNSNDIGCSAEGMLKRMDRIGIDMLCINKWNSPDIGGNDDVAAVIRKYPRRFIGFAATYPSLSAEWNHDELKRCFDEHGFLGIKVHNAYTALVMRDTSGLREFENAMETIWSFAAERKCPVLCHGYLTPQIAKRHPDAIFMYAHAGGVRRVSEDFSDCPNVYLDTAASNLIRGNIEYHVKIVGDGRILYGSDMPYSDPGYRIGQVIASRISNESLKKILGLNMARILGIQPF